MYKLPHKLTISVVEKCKSDLIQLVNNNDVIEIDDTDVVRVDTVGIQLLLAFATYVATQNKKLNWQCQSIVLQNNFISLGFSEAIVDQYLNLS